MAHQVTGVEQLATGITLVVAIAVEVPIMVRLSAIEEAPTTAGVSADTMSPTIVIPLTAITIGPIIR